LPQDISIQCFDSLGNSIPCDSLSSSVREIADSVMRVYSNAGAEKHDDTVVPFFILAFFIVLVVMAAKNAKWQDEQDEANSSIAANEFPGIERSPTNLVYKGSSLYFPDEELVRILMKYFVYYSKLTSQQQQIFLLRLKNFIGEKTFVIHDESGFKEMPVLISAAAVQISFGLEKYLLPHFSHIHIFPEEFIGYHPTLRLLEGNVSGHTINLSWKHFLNGYQLPENGQNVGLHEFAHAFYYQYFETGKHVEEDFIEAFPLFDACGNKAFEMEQQRTQRLYSDYTLRNFQEFWAESIEIFFERPADMKAMYADLYEAMCEILNQDPFTLSSRLA